MLTIVALIPLKKNSLKLRLYFLNSPPLIHFWPSKISSLGKNLARDYGLNLPLLFSPFLRILSTSFLHQMASLSVFTISKICLCFPLGNGWWPQGILPDSEMQRLKVLSAGRNSVIWAIKNIFFLTSFAALFHSRAGLLLIASVYFLTQTVGLLGSLKSSCPSFILLSELS